MTIVVLLVLAAAAGCFAYRLGRGPSLADRVIAVDGLLVTGVAAVATHAMRTGNGSFVPVTVIVSLVAFVSTAIVARYIEGRDV